MFYKILAYPESPKNAVIPPKKENGRYNVYTKEPALENRANRAVVELLAQFLGVPPEKLRIIKGHTSPQKTITRLP